ncbi:MAG: 16S rRNA (cytosine(967)-C(5))-methyltransferase RsmB [Gammaproteobacteria bacterium]|nr:16S rRNA (cytosine(967)-C(5))-methyltransferase RsmB [Gammaproteobacteria bacterium]MDE2263050.1 16S rRNA (cytosine(967)-C(5))-methyltransferase RsmB [Gammaproteobacteria bacterium]
MSGRPQKPGAQALAEAARAVAAVVRGRSADEALAASDASPRRPAVRAIALGTMRWYLRLRPAMEALLSRPEQLTREVHALLIAAAYQIEYSRDAPALVVSLAVDATRALGQPRGAGLVNAVLRRFVRERQALLAGADADLAVRTAHPRWLVQALADAWPGSYEQILQANNAHPPMVLRLNTRRRPPADYLADLAAAALGGSLVDWTGGAQAGSVAVVLERPVAVAALPGFKEGWVSVQDGGAQLAPMLLDVSPGMRVLDACAAPGTKTSHLLESAAGPLDLTAVDIDAGRLRRVEENLSRLGLRARLVAADVRDPASFWDGRPFDRILVDAPCSGTGVIRRHPDIKLLRRAEDVVSFAAAQLEILRAAFGMLAPGGRLVYATCSVLPAENEAVVSRFLQEEPRACPAVMPRGEELAPGGLARPVGTQLLCGGAAGSDGFYYACLEKTTRGT